ncbi:MAG: transcriptional repressor LexA [Pseudomonadota bacterium]
MAEPSDLTERQQGVLAFIIEYQQMHGIAPTVREIGDHFGLRSPGGIHRILMQLKEKGFILAESGKKRSWRSAGPLPEKGIPVLGVIAAGRPLEAVSFSGEEIAVLSAEFGSDDCFALRVSGDSMIEAHIMAGDLAIIRPQQRVENGEIAAVIIQDMMPEATLKILRRNRQTISLEPANRAYAATVFKGAECRKVRVIGKCVGIIRKT